MRSSSFSFLPNEREREHGYDSDGGEEMGRFGSEIEHIYPDSCSLSLLSPPFSNLSLGHSESQPDHGVGCSMSFFPRPPKKGMDRLIAELELQLSLILPPCR